jgi:3-dehydroquinate synthase
MVAAVYVGVETGRIGADVLDRLMGLLNRIGLPTNAGDLAPTARLVEAMQFDKKVADGKLRLILLDKIGAVSIVDDTPADVISAAWDFLRTKGS